MGKYLIQFISLSLLSILMGCQPDPAVQPVDLPVRTTSNYEFYLGDYVDSVVAEKQIPGMAIAVMRAGRVDWTGSYGFADLAANRSATQNTRFRVGPAADIVVAAVVMQMAGENGVDLDENLSTYLPYDLVHPLFPTARITLRMLLGHASGIMDRAEVLDSLYTEGDATQRLRDFLQDYLVEGGSHYSVENFSEDRPGKIYEYSRINIALAAYLVEAVTGVEFDLYCKTRFFKDLGFTSVSWYLSDLSRDQVAIPYRREGSNQIALPQIGFVPYPSGQLRISTEYLGRFWLSLMQGGIYNGQSLIQPSLYQEMLQVPYPFNNEQQALAWQYDTLSGIPILGTKSEDRGMSSRLYMQTDSDKGIVILSNGEGFSQTLDTLAVRLLETAARFD